MNDFDVLRGERFIFRMVEERRKARKRENKSGKKEKRRTENVEIRRREDDKNKWM